MGFHRALSSGHVRVVRRQGTDGRAGRLLFEAWIGYGPLFAGLLLSGTGFAMLINVAVAALALSAIVALIAASMLDRAAKISTAA